MRNKGFTIVELLVVIAILSVLTLIGFVSYIGYAADSRDGNRILNVTKLEQALEARKSSAGKYPTPDNPTNIMYQGEVIFTQGTLGDTTKQFLNFKDDGVDPKYDVNYSYSISGNGSRFEIGTILENEENNTLGFLLPNTYADDEYVTLTHGNYNGRYYSTKIGDELHVFTLPSLTLKNKENFELVLNEPTTNFSISGVGSLPETYVGEVDVDEEVSFTPKLLYRGTNCGVETDQEIINFVSLLRDSYNQEPFISDPKYNKIFEDYEFLKDNVVNFSNIEDGVIDFGKVNLIGEQINESLGCEITEFKTQDIFPLTYGVEQLDFEGVQPGFDIEDNNSVLFDYSGDGSAIVKAGEGNNNSQGLHIDRSDYSGHLNSLKYKAYSYIPIKLQFDVKVNQIHNNWGHIGKFYINDILYEDFYNSDIDYESGYMTYSTPLLRPGLYEFRWEIKRSHMYLDNLEFTCQLGRGTCGYAEGSLDPGFEHPWEMFRFDGAVKTTWPQVSDASQGSTAIKSPVVSGSGDKEYNHLYLNKTLTEPQKFSFDYKADIIHYRTSEGYIKFFINDVEYLYKHRYDEGIQEYATFTTPLLPPGDYEFRWTTRQRWSPSELYLDNLRFTCIGGGGTCGWEENTFEEGSENPWDLFDFEGANGLPWGQVLDANEGTRAIKSPKNFGPGDMEYNNLYLKKTFTEPQKFSFDYKADIRHYRTTEGYMKFYINDIEFISKNRNSEGILEYATFTSPLLPPGDYVFRWKTRQRWSPSELYLDNFQFTCIGGGGTCGWQENTFEEGTANPWDLFDFTGSSNLPWMQVNDANVGNLAIKSPNAYGPGEKEYSNLILNKTLTEPQKFSFDYKADIGQDAYNASVSFFINDTEYMYKRQSSEGIQEYATFTTPLLPPGDYEFRWTTRQRWRLSELYLDNFQFTCIGGGGICGWEENTFEPGASNPWDIFDFTGEITLPWEQVEGGTEGSYALKNPKIHERHASTQLVLNKTFTEPQKITYDIKTDLVRHSDIHFFINDVRYLFLEGDKENYNSGYKKFESPLLPAGDYEFKWNITQRYHDNAYIYLDNIQFTCIGGGGTCGWSENETGENGSENPWDLFTFNGAIDMPWEQVTDSTTGDYAIRNQELPDSFGFTSLISNKTFTEPQKISFDIKTDLYRYSKVSFYINDIRHIYHEGRYSNLNGGYINFESPLLPSGDYEFKWEIEQRHNDRAHIYLDNIQFTCIGGGGTCGWSESETGENGSGNPSDLFTFNGAIDMPWEQVTDSTTGDYAIRNQELPDSFGFTSLISNKTFTEPQKISFDIKTDLYRYSKVSFYINDIRHIYHEGRYSNLNGGYINFESPLLPSGDYEFKWEIEQRYNDRAHIYLDNIQFTCVGGGGICGWSDANTLEKGEQNPWDLFDFIGEINIPWEQVNNEEDGGFAIRNQEIPSEFGFTELVYDITIESDKRFIFDMKTDLYRYSKIKFFINDNEEISLEGRYTNYNDGYQRYESSVFPAGNYELKWQIEQRYRDRAYLFLDNIGVKNIGNTNN